MSNETAVVIGPAPGLGCRLHQVCPASRGVRRHSQPVKRCRTESHVSQRKHSPAPSPARQLKSASGGVTLSALEPVLIDSRNIRNRRKSQIYNRSEILIDSPKGAFAGRPASTSHPLAASAQRHHGEEGVRWRRGSGAFCGRCRCGCWGRCASRGRNSRGRRGFRF